MSNNKDMKEELHKLCDSFFQSEDEEKVAKELKDNLEKFFKVIKDKYGILMLTYQKLICLH